MHLVPSQKLYTNELNAKQAAAVLDGELYKCITFKYGKFLHHLKYGNKMKILLTECIIYLYTLVK